MTHLVGWISVDQTAPAAFYLASDSRITWGSQRSRWDAGRKLFYSRISPDIFGYSGDVTFPSIALPQIVDAMDLGLLFQAGAGATERHQSFVAALHATFSQRHNVPKQRIEIVHVARTSTKRPARFRAWLCTFSIDGSFNDEELQIDHSRSNLNFAFGTGGPAMRELVDKWEISDAAGTSRGIFSALCESIKGGADPLSGGAPQLVGIYPVRLPQPFGVVFGRERYLNGLRLAQGSETKLIEWRDELFQRVDAISLETLEGAQRHVRPKI